MTALFEVEGLEKRFPVRRGLFGRSRRWLRAVDGVDLTLERGECFAVVGESGSGKTTLARAMIRLIEPSAGSLRFRGEDLLALSREELRRRRRHFQMVFQDPYGSLNPRMTAGATLSEPLEVHGIVERAGRRRRVDELLDLVGLPGDAHGRYPHEFSGGQRQRLGIARALATEPALLLADEPVSALDVSVRSQIINLLVRLQRRFGLTLLVIAHDLAVVEQIAHRVGVLYLGRWVEIGPAQEVFRVPQHPYTASLLSAVPAPDPARGRERLLLPGEPPSPLAPPAGCRFHPRCPIARERCARDEPALAETASGVRVACHYPGELVPPPRKPN